MDRVNTSLGMTGTTDTTETTGMTGTTDTTGTKDTAAEDGRGVLIDIVKGVAEGGSTEAVMVLTTVVMETKDLASSGV
jgi:hypothetical protein